MKWKESPDLKKTKEVKYSFSSRSLRTNFILITFPYHTVKCFAPSHTLLKLYLALLFGSAVSNQTEAALTDLGLFIVQIKFNPV